MSPQDMLGKRTSCFHTQDNEISVTCWPEWTGRAEIPHKNAVWCEEEKVVQVFEMINIQVSWTEGSLTLGVDVMAAWKKIAPTKKRIAMIIALLVVVFVVGIIIFIIFQ